MSTQGMRCIMVGLAPFRPEVSSGRAPTESDKTVVVTVEHEDGKPMPVEEILRKVLEETYAAEWLLKILNRNAMVAATAQAEKSCRVNLNYGFGKETVVVIHRKNPADENQAHTERIHVSLVGNDNSSLAPSDTISEFATVTQEAKEGRAPTFRASISVNTTMWMAAEEGRKIELWESDTMHGIAERMVSSAMAGSSSSTAAPAAAAAPAAEAEAESGDEEVAATSSRTTRGATQKKSASKKGSKPSTTTKGGAEKKKSADKEDKDEAPKKKRKKSEDTAAKKKKKSGGAASTAAKGKTSSSSAKSKGESAGAGAHYHFTLEDIDLSKPWSSLPMEIREVMPYWDEEDYNSFSKSLRKTEVQEALDSLGGGKSEDKVTDGNDGDNDDNEDGGSDDGKKKRSKSSAKTTATKGKGRGSDAASKKGSSKAKASKAAAKDSDEDAGEDADGGDGSKATRKGAKLSRDEEEALEEPPEGFTFPQRVLKKFKHHTTEKEKWEIYLDYKKKNREAVARSNAKKKAREEDKSAAVSSDTEKKSTKKRKKSDQDVDDEGAAEQSDDDDDDDNEGAAKKSPKKAKKASRNKKGGKK